MMRSRVLLIAAVLVLGTVGVAQPTAGLVAHFAFDEGQGDVAFSSVGEAVATVVGAQWGEGVTGTAVVLGGRKSYLDCGPATGLLGKIEFTISVWVKFIASAQVGALVAAGNGVGAGTADYGLLLSHTDVGSVRVLLSDGATVQSMRGTSRIGDGAYHHVVFVMSSRSLLLYVDGKLDVAAVVRTTTPQLGEAFGLFLGDLRPRSPSVAWGLVGAVDKLRIYSRALSADEVGALYAEEGRSLRTSRALLGGGIALAVAFLRL